MAAPHQYNTRIAKIQAANYKYMAERYNICYECKTKFVPDKHTYYGPPGKRGGRGYPYCEDCCEDLLLPHDLEDGKTWFVQQPHACKHCSPGPTYYLVTDVDEMGDAIAFKNRTKALIFVSKCKQDLKIIPQYDADITDVQFEDA